MAKERNAFYMAAIRTHTHTHARTQHLRLPFVRRESRKWAEAVCQCVPTTCCYAFLRVLKKELAIVLEGGGRAKERAKD